MRADQFTKNTFYLDFPDQAAIDRIYLEIPAHGRVIITTRVDSIYNVLVILERTGFFGMCVIQINSLKPVARLSAYKGKGGPCYDTGRTAEYSGGALAALDDDNHILFGPGGASGPGGYPDHDRPAIPGSSLRSTPICEKTACLYLSSAYTDMVKVSPANPELLDRLESEPLEFNCNSLDKQAEKLVRSLKQKPQTGGPSLAVLYPGPFRMLIMKDGSMLRRGQFTLIPKSQASTLKKSDKCLLLNINEAADVEKPKQLQKAFKSAGTLCLVENIPFENHLRSGQDLHLEDLEKVPKQMRSKLKSLISRKDKYFILTGSDPWDEYGCCPSREVGAANRLVEAGILTALSTAAAPGTCPTTIYAFSGEIQNKEDTPQFTKNEAVRKRVHVYLKTMRKGPMAIARLTVKLALLLYVAAALVYMIVNPADNAYMQSTLSSLMGNGVLVYYFHPGIRCAACLNMEAYTERTLNLYYEKERRAGTITLERINIDDPVNTKLVERYGIFNSTIVLVKLNEGKVTQQKVLFEQIWELFESENEFIAMLNEELKALMEEEP